MYSESLYIEKATDAEGDNPNISTWHYDSLSRVIRAVCDGHFYEYVYDEFGRLQEKRSGGKSESSLLQCLPPSDIIR